MLKRHPDALSSIWSAPLFTPSSFLLGLVENPLSNHCTISACGVLCHAYCIRRGTEKYVSHVGNTKSVFTEGAFSFRENFVLCLLNTLQKSCPPKMHLAPRLKTWLGACSSILLAMRAVVCLEPETITSKENSNNNALHTKLVFALTEMIEI